MRLFSLHLKWHIAAAAHRRQEEAIALLTAIQQVRGRVLGTDHPDTKDAQASLAAVQAALLNPFSPYVCGGFRG